MDGCVVVSIYTGEIRAYDVEEPYRRDIKGVRNLLLDLRRVTDPQLLGIEGAITVAINS
ncbi:hypothetical protein [Nonomuraea diastatica]|uniref:hypothetical protein n=1 Tax=Nonomuraea diastatica TaxID=1848329 RepID=UPI001407E578|nr:hypothetical protein [Nonomuraea diastatica]